MALEFASAGSIAPHSHANDPQSASQASHWHAVDWKRCFRWLRKLQARIAQAAAQGRWRVVRRLQRLLVRSPAAKLLAVQRVTQNRGKKTPGVDGETWDTPQTKLQAAQSLPSTRYRVQPLRRVYIPKPGGAKKRPLGIPTCRDRAAQCLHKFALEPVAETTADPNSYGFRPMRCCADAIEKCFSVLCRKTSSTWVLEGDIRSCFDEISHAWMEEHIPMDRQVLHAWLTAGVIEQGGFRPTKAGTPQGGIVSPVLCNLVLDGLEGVLNEEFRRRRRPTPKVNWIRYADDFLITGHSKELLEEEVLPKVREFLQQRGLTLSEEKTRITSIHEGFDFLGQHLRKYNGRLLIRPSRKSQAAFRHKVREVLKRCRSTSQEALIWQLNPMLRGWANYHRHVASKQTFRALDHWVWHRVWKWAVREHPQRSKSWIRERYFTTQGARHAVFCANKGVVKGRIRTFPDRDPKGHKIYYPTLFRLESVPIVRHVKIRSAAHPFDRRYEEYLEKRWRHRQPKLYSRLERMLFELQEGRCVRCGERLEGRDTWDIHHLKFRVNGGDDAMENLQLLHLNCHHQLHSQAATESSLLGRPSERLEPDAVKAARPVLRGPGPRKGP